MCIIKKQTTISDKSTNILCPKAFMTGLIGKKIGMTQFYNTEGNVIPVTVIQTGPCVVVQKKENAKDGYNAIQVGFGIKKNQREIGRASCRERGEVAEGG